MTEAQCNTCKAPPDALCRSKEWGYLIAADCLNYEPMSKHDEYKRYRCPYPGITCSECINAPEDCIEAEEEP